LIATVTATTHATFASILTSRVVLMTATSFVTPCPSPHVSEDDVGGRIWTKMQLGVQTMVGALLDLKKTVYVLLLNRTNLRSCFEVGWGADFQVGFCGIFFLLFCLDGLDLEVSWGLGSLEVLDVLCIYPSTCLGSVTVTLWCSVLLVATLSCLTTATFFL
jgi:hypothetical protein